MTYEEAEAAANARTLPDNFMRISLNYHTYLMLPYKDAMNFIAALKNVEVYEEGYSKPPVVRTLGEKELSMSPMSPDVRHKILMAHLLQVPIDKLDALKTQEEPPF